MTARAWPSWFRCSWRIRTPGPGWGLPAGGRRQTGSRSPGWSPDTPTFTPVGPPHPQWTLIIENPLPVPRLPAEGPDWHSRLRALGCQRHGAGRRDGARPHPRDDGRPAGQRAGRRARPPPPDHAPPWGAPGAAPAARGLEPGAPAATGDDEAGTASGPGGHLAGRGVAPGGRLRRGRSSRLLLSRLGDRPGPPMACAHGAAHTARDRDPLLELPPARLP